MDIAVVGAGLMGSVIARDLANARDVKRVVVVDSDNSKLRLVSKESGKTRTVAIDVNNRRRLSRVLADVDACVVALPHGISVAVDRISLESGTNVLDLAFEDSQMKLDRLAKEKKSVLIPGCGLAPGLSNILVVHGSRFLKEAHEGHIWVGGIPQNPQPPLGYTLVFSIKGLLNEYLSRARIMRNGKIVSVDPFSEVEEVSFPSPVGRCEAFFTDGLATLLHSKRKFKQLDERTVRWTGHAEKMRFMIQAGFFERRRIKVDGGEVSPLDFSSALLTQLLKRGDHRDVTVMRVETSGIKEGKHVTVRHELLDKYDETTETTSMGRTTGFTCSIISQMVGRGEIEGRGLLPPEEALDNAKVEKLLRELAARGVKVTESIQNTEDFNRPTIDPSH